MQDGKKILSIEKERQDAGSKREVSGEGQNMTEVKEAQQSVSEGVNVLGETAEVMTSGVVSENEKKAKDAYNGSVSAGGKADGKAAIMALPNIEVMIEQTVTAIENELKVREVEVKVLIRNRNATPYQVNDLVIRIRFLNGLLHQLKRAAKLAEEFVAGLWKQFVGKA